MSVDRGLGSLGIEFVAFPKISSISQKEGLEDIPSNADIKYILKLKPESSCLPDIILMKMRSYIESNLEPRRDIFIKYGEHAVVAKLEPSDLEELYSTDFETFQKYDDLYSAKH